MTSFNYCPYLFAFSPRWKFLFGVANEETRSVGLASKAGWEIGQSVSWVPHCTRGLEMIQFKLIYTNCCNFNELGLFLLNKFGNGNPICRVRLQGGLRNCPRCFLGFPLYMRAVNGILYKRKYFQETEQIFNEFYGTHLSLNGAYLIHVSVSTAYIN